MLHHPKSDIRSMFDKTRGGGDAHVARGDAHVARGDAHVATITITASAAAATEKKKTTKINQNEIDSLYDKYCRAYRIRSDSVKELVKKIFKDIVENCKVSPKKLHRYFNHVKASRNNFYTIEHLLLHPFDFITFENRFISYKDAMNICTEKNIRPPLEKRINAWIYDYFIGENKLYITKKERVKLEIEFNKEFKLRNGEPAAQSLLFDSNRIFEKKFGTTSYFTTQEFIDFEIKTSDKVMELFYHKEHEEKFANDEKKTLDKEIDAHIEKYTMEQNSKKDFKFEPEQVEAIKKGCNMNNMQLFNITGPPGTGKSTIVDCIMDYKLRTGHSIAIMAPTGLAQKNLKDTCKCHSKFDNNKTMFSTVHRALYVTFPDKENDFKPTIMIVDESSMIDLFLFNYLLKACERFKCSLILIGDVKQLPPINVGTPFESIINSKIFDTTFLTNIKRQNGNLKTIIEKLNTPNGVHYDDFDNHHSVFIEAKTPEDFERVITEIYKKEMMQEGADIHTMCVQKEKTGGVLALNPIIQKLKNPHGEELFVKSNGHTFHEGDLVMRTENCYKDEDNVRVNGDVGTIHQTKKKRYESTFIDYTYNIRYKTGKDEEGLTVEDVKDAFMPFYASSVHKMQGLQKTTIVFIVSPEHNYMLEINENSKKLVYTAISRCRSNFYVVGDKSLFLKAQRSKDEFIYPTLFMTEFNDYKI
jgi:hypothetical protein